MKITVSESKTALGWQAAGFGAELIRKAIAKHNYANIIVATGASQFEMLDALVNEPGIDWTKVTCFHLDEYVGVPITHGASFRKYLWERFVRRLPFPLAAFHYVDGEQRPQTECDRLGAIIRQCPIDVAFVGIGENGHLAFNDPPADFKTEQPYVIVTLDEACRKQQLGEGWFPTLADVPQRAISMSCRQIMKSNAVIAAVPDQRKAEAVKNTVEGPMTNRVPASILQEHKNAALFLDRESASLLTQK